MFNLGSNSSVHWIIRMVIISCFSVLVRFPTQPFFSLFFSLNGLLRLLGTLVSFCLSKRVLAFFLFYSCWKRYHSVFNTCSLNLWTSLLHLYVNPSH